MKIRLARVSGLSKRGRGRMLLGLIAAIALSGCSAEPAATPLSQHDFDLLNRLTWGANARDAAAMKKLGAANWVKQQFRPSSKVELPANVAALFEAARTEQPVGKAVVDFEAIRRRASAAKDPAEKQAQNLLFAGPTKDYRAKAETRSLLRDLYSPDQLREQMTWFWFNHFNVRGVAGLSAVLVNDYEENTIRPRALGKFCDLVNATLRHPVMLIYLGNSANTVTKGNENYARELMELHTLGVGTGYTQQDVQQLAKVLTGATLDLKNWPPTAAPSGGARDGLFVFDPAQHDNGKKTLLGQKIKSKGYAEIDEATGILCRQPATAHHVVTRLAQYFVADEPPAALVDRLAKVFQATDGDITAVMTAMIASPEFDASLGTLFKDPQHYTLSALRLAFDDRVIDNIPTLSGMLSRLGQQRFGRVTPDGYPLESANWNATGQLGSRFAIADQVGAGGMRLFSDISKVSSLVAPDIKGTLAAQGLYQKLAPETRSVLAEAKTTREWNSLFLSSPEFMRR